MKQQLARAARRAGVGWFTLTINELLDFMAERRSIGVNGITRCLSIRGLTLIVIHSERRYDTGGDTSPLIDGFHLTGVLDGVRLLRTEAEVQAAINYQMGIVVGPSLNAFQRFSVPEGTMIQADDDGAVFLKGHHELIPMPTN